MEESCDAERQEIGRMEIESGPLILPDGFHSIKNRNNDEQHTSSPDYRAGDPCSPSRSPKRYSQVVVVRPAYIVAFSVAVLISASYVLLRENHSGSINGGAPAPGDKFSHTRPANTLADPAATNCPAAGEAYPVENVLWEKAAASNAARAAGVWDVVFYGDSITEDWSGTRFAQRSARYWDTRDVFNKVFNKDVGGKYSGIALGIAGDTVSNLLWRLRNGELPEGERAISSRVWWILIGTNDFTYSGCNAAEVTAGIIAVAEEVGRKKNGIIVINKILPRGDLSGDSPKDTALYAEIKKVNRNLDALAKSLGKRIGRKVYIFDVPSFFMSAGKINVMNMPDYLHPSTKGHLLWAREIVNFLDKITKKPS